MGETELTKEIKRALRHYNPLMKSSKRTIRWAEEVDTVSGYVDSIRFEDCIVKTYGEYYCSISPCCKTQGLKYPNDNCIRCVHRRNGTFHELGIAATCFEVKISKNDFKSKNGHNFVGNYNYYVIPKELYSEVKGLVPEDIGIIIYHGHSCLIKKKECVYKVVSPEDLSKLLYNAMKKWVSLSYLLK